MASLAQGVRDLPGPSPWLWGFLKEELAPYPGRAGTVNRMIFSATLVMLICVTFRVPFAFQGGLYVLLISRESPRATLLSGGTILLFTGIGATCMLLSARLFINVPILHFLWVVGSFLLSFYVISVMTNYAASSIFAIVIAIAVPLWDRHLPAETNVSDTLWLLLATLIGVMVTAAVELVFRRMRPGDDIVLPVAERLEAVQTLLDGFARDRAVHPATERTLVSLVTRGTSRLRSELRRSDYSPHYRAQMSGVVALVGNLVDTAATLTQLSFQPSAAGRARFQSLATTIANMRSALLDRRIPAAVHFDTDDEPSRTVPLLREMENILALIPQAFAGSGSIDEYLPSSDDEARMRLIAPDALTNAEHLKFALKGCLAASVCYIIYNFVAWPGISTAVTTCLLTALSTIGASRQKQILRLAGAVVGGFVLGMGSQIFILPNVDSIIGFTILFIFVTAAASWFMTSSPRLSYFGLQLALAFYLINLQEFAMVTSLSIARDRVVGILLGLFMMWLVFDQLWSAPAGVEMKQTFISALRLLAQFAREPLSADLRAAIKRAYALRETINAQLDKQRALADGVLFEFGPSRQRDLAWRARIRHWQPQLRTLFLMRVAFLKYRLHLPGFELPEAARLAQQAYDERSARLLEEMADRAEGNAPQAQPSSADSRELLEQTLARCCTDASLPFSAPRVQSFIALLRGIDGLTTSLAEEIDII